MESHSAMSSSGRQQHDLQPARTALHVLTSIVGSPALGQAQSDGMGIKGTVIGGRITDRGVETRQVPVEYLHGEGGRDLEDGESS